MRTVAFSVNRSPHRNLSLLIHQSVRIGIAIRAFEGQGFVVGEHNVIGCVIVEEMEDTVKDGA